jgi:hypothetical protein
VPSSASSEESTVRESASPAMTMLELDPFNSYARAIAAPEMEIPGSLVNNYLFEAYRHNNLQSSKVPWKESKFRG